MDQSQSIKRPTILSVMAHPDDETFGMGGTLALYASRGAAVHVVCATRGEVGTVDEDLLHGYSSVAELREAELRCAAQTLKLTGVHFLNYRDSGMPGSIDNQNPLALVAAPTEKVVEDVVSWIRQLKPQIVLTFDPIGGYRHPDHIAIQQATVKAFTAAGDPQAYPDCGPAYAPQRLYFQTMPKGALKFLVRVLPLVGVNPRKFGRNKDIDIMDLVKEDFPIHAEIDYSAVADQRDKAARCHASQGGQEMTKGIQGIFQRFLRRRELFMQAFPQPDGSGNRTHDLFSGVDVTC